jgi:hypothetical protein
MMEAEGSSKTLVTLQTTQRHISENNNLRSHRRDNLKANTDWINLDAM